MKFANLLTKFYFEPWFIRPDKHAAMGKLFNEYLKSGKILSYAEDEEPSEPSSPMEVHFGVAWIPVHGVLGKRLSSLELLCGGCDYDDITEMTEQAIADPAVKTIIYDFDSPGGMGLGLPECASVIKSAGQSHKTIGWTEGGANSACYWLASQCSELYCSPSSTVGSIGAYAAAMDSSREWEMEGWKLELFQSGAFKGMGLEGKAWTDQERAFLQQRVDRSGAAIRAAVSSMRPQVSTSVMDGRFFDGDEAYALGLVDGVANKLEDIVRLVLATQ